MAPLYSPWSPERSDVFGTFERVRLTLTNCCGQESRASAEGDISHLMLNYHKLLGLAGYLSCCLRHAVNSGRPGCSCSHLSCQGRDRLGSGGRKI